MIPFDFTPYQISLSQLKQDVTPNFAIEIQTDSESKIILLDHSFHQSILDLINDSASAYKGVIPSQLYEEPYFNEERLNDEIDQKVYFYGLIQEGNLTGVMGVQEFHEVILIRHSYVKTLLRNRGIGSRLLQFHKARAKKPILVGCLKSMTWAIRFYEKNGFE